ncbi:MULTISPECIES: hypothetical protein [Cyanophyceae]|uniref:hypothetical protein n=1 Tax=Cyanophyceae TaxID=3028117 RepID=UPI001683D285|nr:MULTISPECIES: hypothetical protein [Cyanophyceae]MBD1917852.1 hypothetical protein [Phormidium sp. FACHB-77]MBD2032970.1 hypothetical protein [Phormidium sp. FACHB-322]MBD2051718.1 hypothetical protein [Leptolyngbya sp. FACHB-60]
MYKAIIGGVGTVRALEPMDNTPPALYVVQASTPVQTPVTPSATPTGLELTPVLVALVTGVIGIATGVATGWITAIYAPKANWEVDKEKLDYEQKRIIVKELREAINDKSETILAVLDHDYFEHVDRELDSTDRKIIEELEAEINDFMDSYYKARCGIDMNKSFNAYNILETIEYAQFLEKHRSEITSISRRLSTHGDVKSLLKKIICDLEVKWGLVNLR